VISVLVAMISLSVSAQNYSEWARPGTGGHVAYKERTDTNIGDRLPDFSMVGYGAGLRSMPNNIPGLITVNPVAGDNTAAIQSAINFVASQPVQPNGYRGAVVLGPGQFNVNGIINVNASGVVIRGSGIGDNPAAATWIVSQDRTGSLDDANPAIRFAGSTSNRVYGSQINITDQRVPVGAMSFNVQSAAGLSVGRMVEIYRPSTQAWVDAIGMTPYWSATERDLKSQRTITRIEGNRVYLDSPITTAIDKQWSTGTIRTYDLPGQIHNVGIENLRGQSLDAREETNESRAWSFVEFSRVADAFLRDAEARHFPYAAVYSKKDDGTQFITVERVASSLPSGEVTGGRRYSFAVDSEMSLVRDVSADNGRHDFVTGSNVNGPIVFLDSDATHVHADAGPHHRWGNGLLFDNIRTNGEINIRNRGDSGSGHGWAGANSIIWNSDGSRFAVQSPPTAQNWLIGTGPHFNDTFGTGVPQPAGIYESENQRVSMGNATANPLDSLYVAQLLERQQYYVDQRFWTGAGGSTTWNATSGAGWTNWSNKLIYNTNVAGPGARDDVIFNVKGSSALTTSPGANTSVASLQFDAPTAPVTVQLNNTNNVLTIGGRGVTVFAGSHTITGTAGGSGTPADLILAGAQVWEIRGSGKLTVNARMRETTGGQLFQKNGTGTLELQANSGGSSSMKITVMVNEGILRATSGGSLGFSGNTITVDDGAALELSNVGTLSQTNSTITLSGMGFNNAGGALRNLTGSSRIGTGTGQVVLGTAETGVGVDAGSLAIDQVITGAGGLTKVGAGTLTIGGTAANTFAGATKVNAGTVELGKPAGVVAVPGNLTVAGGTVRLLNQQQIGSAANVSMTGAGALLDLGGKSQTVSGLTLSAGSVTTGVTSGTPAVLRTSSISITGTGKLDLANNRLIVDYDSGGTPIESIRGMIGRAYANGTWTGAGLDSSTLAAGHGLGYAEASDVVGPSGGTFAGQTVDGSAVVAFDTLLGDTTLDGRVDFADLVNLAQRYNVADGHRVWFEGDFNYDGKVDFSDLVMLAQNYNAALPGMAAGAAGDFAGDLQAAFASVPEAGTLSLLAVAAGAMAMALRRGGREGAARRIGRR
jgi:autotransporter-associated beta strand protein